MRNALPRKPKLNESAIINLDDKENAGTHWTAYIKRGKKILYYDSFGSLVPPLELINYFGKNADIKYNYKRFQKDNSFNCGHLSLEFLIMN